MSTSCCQGLHYGNRERASMEEVQINRSRVIYPWIQLCLKPILPLGSSLCEKNNKKSLFILVRLRQLRSSSCHTNPSLSVRSSEEPHWVVPEKERGGQEDKESLCVCESRSVVSDSYAQICVLASWREGSSETGRQHVWQVKDGRTSPPTQLSWKTSWRQHMQVCGLISLIMLLSLSLNGIIVSPVTSPAVNVDCFPKIVLRHDRVNQLPQYAIKYFHFH